MKKPFAILELVMSLQLEGSTHLVMSFLTVVPFVKLLSLWFSSHLPSQSLPFFFLLAVY